MEGTQASPHPLEVAVIIHPPAPARDVQLVDHHQKKLQLTPKQVSRWAGKRYLVLIEVGGVRSLEPFGIDRRAYGNMDDWLTVEEIRRVKVM